MTLEMHIKPLTHFDLFFFNIIFFLQLQLVNNHISEIEQLKFSSVSTFSHNFWKYVGNKVILNKYRGLFQIIRSLAELKERHHMYKTKMSRAGVDNPGQDSKDSVIRWVPIVCFCSSIAQIGNKSPGYVNRLKEGRVFTSWTGITG